MASGASLSLMSSVIVDGDGGNHVSYSMTNARGTGSEYEGDNKCPLTSLVLLFEIVVPPPTQTCG